MKRALHFTPVFALLCACSRTVSPDVGTDEAPVIEDAASMVARPDGAYDVTCKDGRTEVATAEQIRSDAVCAPVMQGCSTDLFDACWTERPRLDLDTWAVQQAFLSTRGLGLSPRGPESRAELGAATVVARERLCTTGSSNGTSCDAWSDLPRIQLSAKLPDGTRQAISYATASLRPTVRLERVSHGLVDLHLGATDATDGIRATCPNVPHGGCLLAWQDVATNAYLVMNGHTMPPRVTHLTAHYLYQRATLRAVASGPLETSFPGDHARVERETEIALYAPFGA